MGFLVDVVWVLWCGAFWGFWALYKHRRVTLEIKMVP